MLHRTDVILFSRKFFLVSFLSDTRQVKILLRVFPSSLVRPGFASRFKDLLTVILYLQLQKVVNWFIHVFVLFFVFVWMSVYEEWEGIWRTKYLPEKENGNYYYKSEGEVSWCLVSWWRWWEGWQMSGLDLRDPPNKEKAGVITKRPSLMTETTLLFVSLKWVSQGKVYVDWGGCLDVCY